MSTRVWLPTTLADLASYLEAGVVPATVERFVADDDGEESEYAALLAAADASAELLTGAGRRVVVVAELDDPDAEAPLRTVVAVHADTDDSWDPDDDLAWFASQEIEFLIS